MRERFSFGPGDRRNLAIVVAVMTLVLTITAEGPLGVRIIVGLVGGVFSGVVFLVVTLLIDAYGPDYW